MHIAFTKRIRLYFDNNSVTNKNNMNTYISTSEYMFRASVDFNKKLKDCTEQELESIKTKVLLNRKVSHEMKKRRLGY